MATVEQYLDDAASYIGVSGDYNEFNRWYWCDLNGYDYNPGWAWCGVFQSYVGVHDLDMPFTPSASAAAVANQGVRVADSEARAGDWVLFNWDNRQDFSWADHIGVVEWSDINGSGYFGTIEGNTGNSEVARCTRYNWGSYATAFFRPPYGGEHKPMPEQIPGSTVNNAGLYYQVHAENAGWFDTVRDGQTAGSVGYSCRMEALRINPLEGGWELRVKVHLQNIGWRCYSGIVHGNDVVIGTTGESRRIEDIIIEVVNRPANDKRKLYFRVHQQDYGWKAWTEEGFASGTDGMGIRLEAIQMKIE